MADIWTSRDLEGWLFGKPLNVSTLLAVRSALRVLPLSSRIIIHDSEDIKGSVFLPMFRASYLSHFIIKCPRINVYANLLPARESAINAAIATEFQVNKKNASVLEAVQFAISTIAYAQGHLPDRSMEPVVSRGNVSTRSAVLTATDAVRSASEATLASVISARATTDVWEAVSADADSLGFELDVDDRDDVAVEFISRMPLWPASALSLQSEQSIGMPDWIAGEWFQLRDHLIQWSENWDVWVNWYEGIIFGSRGRCDGLPVSRITEITDEDWPQGPSHVNAKIRAIEARFLGEKFPARRLLDADLQTGEIIFDRTPPDDPQTYRRICRELLTSVLRLRPQLTNFYAEIREPCELLREVLENEDEHPVTVFRRIAQASLSISRAFERDAELAGDDKAIWLVGDLRQAFVDIPRSASIVAEWIEKRGEVEIIGLTQGDLGLVADAAAQIVSAAREEVAREIERGMATLRGQEPGAVVEGEVDKATIFTLGWMLFDVSRLERTVGRVVQGTDAMGKLAAAIDAANKLFHVLLRLLT